MKDTTRDGRPTVLIVDDISNNISLLNEVLMDEYGIRVAKSGAKAIEIARSMPVDLILLDVMMPEMDGFETCRRLKLDPLTRRIPVIFVTARGEVEDESMGFSCGGVDYITKPIRPTIVRARVRTHLALYDQNLALDEMVRQRTAELRETRMEILNRLGRAAEYRDNETGMHVVRMSRYARIIAFEYGLPADEAELLFSVAPMHDVGKIGIPDRVLLKPGKLDEEEWRIMQGHCDIGRRIIGHHSSELLQAAATLAHTHHEKWDGSGYPQGLKGDEIPISARLMAVSDVYDALISRRIYKQPYSHSEAVAYILQSKGTHFDPDVIDAFLAIEEEFAQIAERYQDERGH